MFFQKVGRARKGDEHREYSLTSSPQRRDWAEDGTVTTSEGSCEKNRIAYGGEARAEEVND